MKIEEINSFMALYGGSIPPQSIQAIYSRLEQLPSDSLPRLLGLSLRSPNIAFTLSLCFGYLGFDRFYIGDWLIGFLKLCTAGLGGILMVIDWIRIGKLTRRRNLTVVKNAIRREERMMMAAGG